MMMSISEDNNYL